MDSYPLDRIMGPDEVRVLSQPFIDQQMVDINRRLVAGNRCLVDIPSGYVTEVGSRLNKVGWEVKIVLGIIYIRAPGEPREYPFKRHD